MSLFPKKVECSFKAAVCNLYWLKNIENQFLGKYITSQHSKLSSYLSLIRNSKLVIMFSNLSGFRRIYNHATVRLSVIMSRL